MDSGIVNTWASNLLQIPLTLICTFGAGIIKRRCCDRAERPRRTWRHDMLRQTSSSIYGFTMILIIATAFDGDDCVNFFTVYASDIVVGILLESCAIQMMRTGGYKLGFYGNPTSAIKIQQQTMLTCLISVMARCTSGIIAIWVFPVTNKHFESHATTDHGWAYMVVVAPAMYMIIRVLVMDTAYAPPQIYARVRHINLSSSEHSAFAVGNASSDDDVTAERQVTEDTDHAACGKQSDKEEQEHNSTGPSGQAQDA